jgi:hypothetical protein
VASLIYDMISALVFVLAGVWFLLGAYKKFPESAQKVFDGFLPWSRRIPIFIAIVMFFNAANLGYDVFSQYLNT